jgi:hypothetical protein
MQFKLQLPLECRAFAAASAQLHRNHFDARRFAAERDCAFGPAGYASAIIANEMRMSIVLGRRYAR